MNIMWDCMNRENITEHNMEYIYLHIHIHRIWEYVNIAWNSMGLYGKKGNRAEYNMGIYISTHTHKQIYIEQRIQSCMGGYIHGIGQYETEK